MPAQINTRSQSMRPRSVSTPCTRPSRISKPVTVTPPSNETPRSDAFAASAVTIRTAFAIPSLGTRYAPEDRARRRRAEPSPRSRPGSAAVSSMPYERANPCRRRSSAIRSGVVAISMPPTPNQPGSPSTASEPYRRTVSCAIRHIVREPFVWKTRPGACDVDPPVSNSGPWSITRTSVDPELRQMIGGARAHDARADDDRLRPVAHPASLLQLTVYQACCGHGGRQVLR